MLEAELAILQTMPEPNSSQTQQNVNRQHRNRNQNLNNVISVRPSQQTHIRPLDFMRPNHRQQDMPTLVYDDFEQPIIVENRPSNAPLTSRSGFRNREFRRTINRNVDEVELDWFQNNNEAAASNVDRQNTTQVAAGNFYRENNTHVVAAASGPLRLETVTSIANYRRNRNVGGDGRSARDDSNGEMIDFGYYSDTPPSLADSSPDQRCGKFILTKDGAFCEEGLIVRPRMLAFEELPGR